MQPTDEPSAPPAAGWGRDLALLALGIAALLALGLGLRALWGPDEGRYVEIPREMVAAGDYLTPRLNGVKYFEKPVLFYWLEAGAIRLFGLREWAMRLWPALFALGGCLAVYAAGRRLFDRRTGLVAAVALATSPLYCLLGTVITLDMAVSTFLVVGLLAFLVGIGEPPGHRRRLLLWGFYLCAALATLTKGLIGIVIPGMVIFAWLLLTGEWRLLRRAQLPSGIVLFLLVAAPWHVLVAHANPEFNSFYFIHEHLLRYTTKIHDRYEPPWFFLPVLLAGMLPWAAFLPPAVRAALPASWAARRERAAPLFLLLWAGLVLLFFSLSDSKLIPYVLPAVAPLALLVGRYLAAAWERPRLPGLAAGFTALLAISGGAAALLAVAPRALAGTPKVAPYVELLGVHLPLLAAALLLAATVPFVLWRRGRSGAAVAAVAAGAALCLALLFLAAPIFNGERSVRGLARWLAPRLRPDDAVVTYHCYLQELPVYLGRRITVAHWKGELEFGTRVEDASGWMIDEPAFARLWRGPRTVYAFAERADYEKLAARYPGSVRLLARSGDRRLAVNRPAAGKDR
jgi:4-amino-4-deoxy-L-arabinose transferase-like glycosyltransferase